MKRLKHLLSFLMLLSILLSSGGIAVYKHYCGDFLASLSLYSPGHGCGDDESAACDKNDSKMDCCEDETEFYQAELDLVKPEKLTHEFHFFTIPYELDQKIQFVSSSQTFTELNDRGPPFIRRPLYITLSRLTYYG